jgi:predicted permease
VLDMTPALGRFFTPADAPQGANAFVVLSHSSWQNRFRGDSGVIGRVIRVNGAEFTVTGVAPKGFKGMRALGFWPELWAPAGMHETLIPGSSGMLEGRGRGWIMAFARMRDGWDIDRTRTAADAFARRLEEQFPGAHPDRGVVILPARSGLENPQFVKPQILMLSSALGIVATVIILLIICANLANLQLARSAARAREFAIRLSLGCSRQRLIRQLLVETLVLAFPGALIAAAIVWATPLVEPFMLPRLQFRVGMALMPNVRIALFTTAIGLTTILLLGLIPAFRATRATVAPSLANVVGSPRRTPRRRVTVRGMLVVSQLAMSVVLLVGGALFIRSLLRARASDVGFDVQDRLLVSVNVGLQGYDEARGRRFYDDVLTRVRSRADVVSASWAFPAPFDTHDRGIGLYVEGAANTRDGTVPTSVSVVAEDFVNAIGLRLGAGRGFEPRDSAGAPGVMVVSHWLATRLWPGEVALGKRARLGGPSGPEITVIGVVGDAKFQSLGQASPARAYLALRQRYRDWQTLVVHTRGNPRAAFTHIRDVVAAADPTLPVFGVMTMEEAVASGLSVSRTAAAAAGSFGVLALLIAAVGLYAVVASSVTERTREIGLRMALGSTPLRVMQFVMANGARLGAWGLALGLPVALIVARGMAGLLVGVSPFDWVTFVAVPFALSSVVLAATYLPARRAVKLDPMSALRAD